MTDLVKARMPIQNPVWSVLGQPKNTYQSDVPARSNLEFLGLGGAADTAAALTTQVMTVVAIPVDVGNVISTISVRTGATAAGTPTNSWAALYQGYAPGNASATLMAQSTTGGAGAIAASTTFTFTLSSPQTINSTNAPTGYVYAAIMVAATTVPSLSATTVATAVAGPMFTGGATVSLTSGAALTTTAPGLLASGSAQAAVPFVFLQ